jgi:AcrR family transcriptional regulator
MPVGGNDVIKARTKLTAVSSRTREQLLLTGERLFALHGLDIVSLRQINLEAGQRNSSAAHYHFGSKDAMIAAIYEYRMECLNARRNELLAALPPASGPRSVLTMIEILVYPMVAVAEHSEGGHSCLRFLSQLFNHPRLDLTGMWRRQFGESVGRVYYELRTALPKIPDEVFGPRFGLMWLLAVNALADRERLRQAPASVVSHTLPLLFVSNLVDSLAGLMSAPASASTIAEISELRSGGQRLA